MIEAERLADAYGSPDRRTTLPNVDERSGRVRIDSEGDHIHDATQIRAGEDSRHSIRFRATGGGFIVYTGEYRELSPLPAGSVIGFISVRAKSETVDTRWGPPGLYLETPVDTAARAAAWFRSCHGERGGRTRYVPPTTGEIKPWPGGASSRPGDDSYQADVIDDLPEGPGILDLDE